MRCRHVVDAVTGIALEGAARDEALRSDAVKRCRGALRPGDEFCPQCGGAMKCNEPNEVLDAIAISSEP